MTRYALIADEDEIFRERLSALLSNHGIELIEADDTRALLSSLERVRPEIVFIAVELPGKEGFSLFSRVKNVQRRVPVVLTTSTVSRADMMLHEKLRVHAEVYRDKGDLSDEALLEILETHIGLTCDESAGEVETPEEQEPIEASEDASEPEDATPVASRDAHRAAELDPRLVQSLDPETVAILAEIDEESMAMLSPTAGSTEDGDATPERLAELEAEVQRLQAEVDEARRDARSSPFSNEFVNLREIASRKDEELRALSGSLARRDSQVLVVKRKLTELATRLVRAQRDRDEQSEEATELRGLLETTRARLDALSEESERHRRHVEGETKQLKEKLGEERVRATVSRHELEKQLAELRAEHAQALRESENGRAEALNELETILRDEKTRAIAELTEKYNARHTEAEDARSRALAMLKEEHDTEIASLHAAQRESMERAAVESQETLRQSAAKSARVLELANEQREADLARVEEKRVTDLRAAEQRHADKVSALMETHRAECEALTQKADSAVKANEEMLEEVNAKVQDVLKSWENERKAHHETREQFERELAELHEEHTRNLEQAEQDQFLALAGLTRQFREERTRVLEIERARWQEKAVTLQKEHAEALASIHRSHQEEKRVRDAAHENAIAQKEREREQAVLEALERASSNHRQELERERRGLANQLASLRLKNEREMSALQASHIAAVAHRDQQAQQAIRDAVERVRADSQDHLEQIRDEHGEALAVLRREHEEELAILEEAHRSAVAQQETAANTALRAVETERDEARVTIDALRAEAAEIAAKHRSSSTTAEEQHTGELNNLEKTFRTKLSRSEDEKQFLAASIEKLKRQSTVVLKQATDSIAYEKQIHQATRERYERRISELKDYHAERIKRIEKDWMEKLGHLEHTLDEKRQRAVGGTEEEWKSKLDNVRLQYEVSVASLQKEFELKLAASDQQVTRARGFEESYQDVSQELTALKVTIEELKQELSEAHERIQERQKFLEESERRASESRETIDSLKAVINDFSRSVDGYLRDRDDQDQTILSLKAVIDDMYRSIGGPDDLTN